MEVKNIRQKYLFALGGIALLLILSQILIQYQIRDQRDDGEVINIAGRQRMLSEKIVKSILSYQIETQSHLKEAWKDKAENSLALWEASHRWLKRRTVNIPNAHASIVSKYAEMEPYRLALLSAAKEVLDGSEKGTIENLFEQQEKYLPRMNQIVKAYESQTHENNILLGRLEIWIFIMAILLLFIEARWIFQPMIQNIERSIIRIEKDAAQLKKQNTALTVAKEEAEEASRVKSEFLSNMSHEIRTPMNGIIGMSGLLEKTSLDPEQREYVESIIFSSESLLMIINDILDISKIEAGKLEIDPVPCQIREVVENTLSLMAPLANNKKIELFYEWDHDIPKVLHADGLRIQQILINLIGNGIKFTEKGHVYVKTKHIEKKQGKHVLSFEVIDSGIGIPKEKQEKLFEAFTQADSSTTRKYGGTGLGLTITKELVQMMDGEIGIWSEEGKGSTFHFTLPLLPEKHPDTFLQKTQNIEKLVGKYLWLIDDHPLNLTMLERQSKQWGMRFTSFNSPREVLQTLKENPEVPDLILSDFFMPDMDGYKLMQRVKLKPNFHHVPAILLTSAAEISEKHKALFHKCLFKPIRYNQLSKYMLHALEGESQLGKPSISKDIEILAEQIPLRILMAEDNIINQKYMDKLFQKLGYTITLATNGQEAVDLCKINHFDLIFMDMQMPVMGGIEAAERILDGTYHLPKPIIIALTANAMEKDKRVCMEAGMLDFVSKPVKIDEMKHVIQHWGQKVLAKQ